MSYLRFLILLLLVLAGGALVPGVCQAGESPRCSQDADLHTCCALVAGLKGQPPGPTDKHSLPLEKHTCDVCPSCLDADLADQMIISYTPRIGGEYFTAVRLPLLAGHTHPLLRPPQL